MIKIKGRSILLALAGVTLSFSSRADVILDGRFSEGNFSSYRAVEANGVAGRGTTFPSGISDHLALSIDPQFSSRTVMAATRLSGDLPTGGGYRSEVSANFDPLGAERWYSFGIYLPSNWSTRASEVILMQIHDSADSNESGLREPTLRLSAQGDVIRLINSYDYDAITSLPGTVARKGIDYSQRTLSSWALEKETWTYFDIHAIWAGNDSGVLEIWKNGVNVFTEKNHINTFNDQSGVWFKAGTYTYPNSNWTSLTSYFTGVKIGDGSETLQTMTMVPEPSLALMLVIGGSLVIGSGMRRRKTFALGANDAS